MVFIRFFLNFHFSCIQLVGYSLYEFYLTFQWILIRTFLILNVYSVFGSINYKRTCITAQDWTVQFAAFQRPPTDWDPCAQLFVETRRNCSKTSTIFPGFCTRRLLFLFTRFKGTVKSISFAYVPDVQQHVTLTLRSIPNEVFPDSFHQLYVCWRKSLFALGDYFEGD